MGGTLKRSVIPVQGFGKIDEIIIDGDKNIFFHRRDTKGPNTQVLAIRNGKPHYQ